MALETFNPAYTQGVTLTATTTSSRSACGQGSMSLVVSNLGTVAVYVRVGTSTVTATAADYVVLPGQQVSLTKFQDHTHIAALSVSGSQSVHVIPGEGF